MSPRQQSVIDLKAEPMDAPVETTALVPVEAPSLLERLASLPGMDPEKLDRLIAANERIVANQAKAAFNAAFAKMQPRIPVIVERGATDKGSFAELEDIIEAVRPILAEFGFAVNHKTEWPSPAQVRIVGILRHRDGHQETSEFLSAPDNSGSKNGIQALGSAVAYGRRYTTKDLLCIVTRGEGKDDGNRAGKPDGPDGFDAWSAALEGVADDGIAKLTQVFNGSKPEFKNHLLKHYPKEWASLKSRAQKAAR